VSRRPTWRDALLVALLGAATVGALGLSLAWERAKARAFCAEAGR
jgi:hypothetical protein